ncbi:hypothetical protein ONE63_008117 [Megalurothrips usitatus]|uniref:Farnesyl pyrophosphate synthase n=1 Tax=Megalurothrips usitatus TaxID=439358 RepID=A0AAV7XK55_9NEOP|nr:hypothetical protein ONE63_008117 [Megalurothrips usitatus]
MDDITDSGNRRWGRKVWWRLPEVGLNAVNDASILEHMGYQILKQEFQDNPNFVELMDLLQRGIMMSSVGRNYDEHVANPQHFDEISPKTYSDVVFLKNTYIAFYLPTMSGLLANGRGKDPRTHRAVTDMAHDLGLMLQFQDDFEDCYNEDEEDPRLDVRTGRCSWPIVAAKERANDKQMKILRDNYGKREKKNVDAVMSVFNDLRIAEVFQTEQEVNFQRIQEKIDQNADILPPAIFNYAFDTMRYYRRILRE